MSLNNHLQLLELTGLIQLAEEHPDLEYLFRHVLIQDAVYESLLRTDRQRLHGAVGQTLEHLYADHLSDIASLLGQHFAQARQANKAITYLLQAGDKARHSFAHEEAIRHYEESLSIALQADNFEQAARIQMKLGLAHHNAFNYRQARLAYDAGFKLWQKAGDATTKTLAAAPHPLRLAGTNPVTLDPARSRDLGSQVVIGQLFRRLITMNSEMDLLPDLAESWEISEAGQYYVFHLRDDVYWSDGVPLTAHDIAFSWRRTLDPITNAPGAAMLFDLKGAQAFHLGQLDDVDALGIHVLDETTLAVELEKPTSTFLYHLITPPTMPVPRHIVRQYGDAWATEANIVTSAAFQLERWQPHRSLTLTRNPTYSGRIGGNVARVELQLDRERPYLLEQYQADTLDVLHLHAAEVGLTREQFAGESLSTPAMMCRFLGFVVTHPPFDDIRVRQAFALAIDRERYADEMAQGMAVPATGFLPTGVPGHTAESILVYAPEQARRRLAEAGFPDGENLPPISLRVRPTQERLAAFLQSQWQDTLGVTVTLTDTETATPLYLSGWTTPFPEPNYFMTAIATVLKRLNQWQSPVYEAYLDDARQIDNLSSRIALYQKADQLLLDQLPIFPITYEPAYVLVKSWVKKYPMLANGFAWWTDVVIEPH